MPASSYEFRGVHVYVCATEGPQLRSDRDAVDLMSEASEFRADLIVIPTERLGGDFFLLRTRIAGEILQKFVTYGKRVAIAGDIARELSASSALRDFVRECNRGNQIWFVADMTELNERLAGQAPQQ